MCRCVATDVFGGKTLEEIRTRFYYIFLIVGSRENERLSRKKRGDVEGEKWKKEEDGEIDYKDSSYSCALELEMAIIRVFFFYPDTISAQR